MFHMTHLTPIKIIHGDILQSAIHTDSLEDQYKHTLVRECTFSVPIAQFQH
jgi:hypothetical protein